MREFYKVTFFSLTNMTICTDGNSVILIFVKKHNYKSFLIHPLKRSFFIILKLQNNENRKQKCCPRFQFHQKPRINAEKL